MVTMMADQFKPQTCILLYFPDGSSTLVRVLPKGSPDWNKPIGDGAILRIKEQVILGVAAGLIVCAALITFGMLSS